MTYFGSYMGTAYFGNYFGEAGEVLNPRKQTSSWGWFRVSLPRVMMRGGARHVG